MPLLSLEGVPPFVEAFNGVNRQPSNGLKVNRQLSKKFIFYRQPSKMGHSQLWDRDDLDTTFASFKSVYLNPKSNVRAGYI